MKQRLNLVKIAFLGTGLALLLSLGFMATATLAAAPACDSGGLTLTSGINCAAPDSASKKGLFDGDSLFKAISNTLIIVIGAVAVIMVIIGGLRYVLSAGNPSATAGAKDQILYSVIGVIVALLSYAIVNYVVSQFK